MLIYLQKKKKTILQKVLSREWMLLIHTETTFFSSERRGSKMLVAYGFQSLVWERAERTRWSTSEKQNKDDLVALTPIGP